MSATSAEQFGVGFEHPDGVADRAPLDLEVAAFEAFSQSLGAQVVIDETDDPVANDDRRRVFRRLLASCPLALIPFPPQLD